MTSGENSPGPKEDSLPQEKDSTVTASQFETPTVNSMNGGIVQANNYPDAKTKCSIRSCPMLHEKLVTCDHSTCTKQIHPTCASNIMLKQNTDNDGNVLKEIDGCNFCTKKLLHGILKARSCLKSWMEQGWQEWEI